MDALLRDALHRVWGFSEFRPLQREAMHAILDSHDSIVVLPTGGGKSLCFQAPAVAAEGLGLVVSPLISLMKDQVDGLRVDEETISVGRSCARRIHRPDAETRPPARRTCRGGW